MSRYLIIGAWGQLGTDLHKTFDHAGELIALSHQEIDVCDYTGCQRQLDRLRPDFVINLAAYHRVDECEDQYEKAFAVNAHAVGHLAKVCQDIGAVLVHFSTDYVFNGSRKIPWKETDPTDPLNAYGASKRAGESLLKMWCQRYFIFRVTGLYGVAGSSGKGGNFVQTMLRMARENRKIRVVDDQILTPTYTMDLARKVWEVIRTGQYGIYHCTNAGECSWYEFADQIFKQSRINANLSAQSTAESGAKARRPPYSVLAHENLAKLGLDDMPPWQDALARYLKEAGVI
jgi:dTDP-4-dehydrorhamnose reductase